MIIRRYLIICSWKLCLFLQLCSAMASSTTKDMEALLAFKSMIREDPSGALTTWNETNPMCQQWEGVICNHQGSSSTSFSDPPPPRVIALNLSSMGLSGTVSPYIGNLTSLLLLDLSGNAFSGEIPPEIGTLTRLELLDLSTNSLRGEIPTSLANCTSLMELNLNSNQLSGNIPPAIGSQLTKLYVLYLAKNALSGVIPPTISNLTSLNMLALMSNNLQGSVPEGIGQLKFLGVFQVSSNRLSGNFPSQLFNISSLWFLAAAGNLFAGSLPDDMGAALPDLQELFIGGNIVVGSIPASLPNASNLHTISFAGNYLQGALPSNLGLLRGLQLLDLESNNLGGSSSSSSWEFIFDSLTNCTQLQTLLLNSNNFSGAIPNSISRLSPTLRTLLLSDNPIGGTITLGIKNLTNLSLVEMSNNLLTGQIPEGITGLDSMLVLDLSLNQLTGQIPRQLGNMTLLSDIYLNHNKLTGPIPPEIGKLRHLSRIELDDNQLNGTIPREMFGITTLLSLHLDNNLLTGLLPPEIGDLQNIITVGVAANNLSGEIPHTLGSCLVLEYLDMSDNSFVGELPSSLNNLKGIIWFNVSHNLLSGSINDRLRMEDMPFLDRLDLSFNRLEGEVPTKGVFLNASATFLSGNKGLCGGIAELELPPCAAQPYSAASKPSNLHPSSSSSLSSSTKKLWIFGSAAAAASLFALLGLLTVAFLNLFAKRSTSEKHHHSNSETMTTTVDTSNYYYPRVSYTELFKATQGFSINNLAGSGAHGSVYKGRMPHPSSAAAAETITVAVKVFNLQKPGAAKSFRAEQKALQSVRHRNLVKILSTCSDVDSEGNEFKAVVYEFMPNGSLEAWLHHSVGGGIIKRRLSLISRLSIAIDVAEALHYLHSNGCTRFSTAHCDVKPSNVLLDGDMIARLTDFGLARQIVMPTHVIRLPQKPLVVNSSIGIRGSVGYIAPEFGGGGQPSIFSDVYSYGILLLEMFTGRRPVDELFKDGLNLCKYVKMALPDRAIAVVDHLILAGSESEDGINDCLVSVLKIGLSCSNQHPHKRMKMNDVTSQMIAAMNAYMISSGRSRSVNYGTQEKEEEEETYDGAATATKDGMNSPDASKATPFSLSVLQQLGCD